MEANGWLLNRGEHLDSSLSNQIVPDLCSLGVDAFEAADIEIR